MHILSVRDMKVANLCDDDLIDDSNGNLHVLLRQRMSAKYDEIVVVILYGWTPNQLMLLNHNRPSLLLCDADWRSSRWSEKHSMPASA